MKKKSWRSIPLKRQEDKQREFYRMAFNNGDDETRCPSKLRLGEFETQQAISALELLQRQD